MLKGVARTYHDVTGAREVLAEFVERSSHDAVGGVESLFHTVAVVDVDVNVEHALFGGTGKMIA